MKTLAKVLIIMGMVLIFDACSNSSKSKELLNGKWAIEKIAPADSTHSTSVALVAIMLANSDAETFYFGEEGVFQLTNLAGELIFNASYQLNPKGDSLVISNSDEKEEWLIETLNDNQLVLRSDGMIISLGRK